MNFFRKTLGGLSFSYYIRHFLFGLIFFIMTFILVQKSNATTGNMIGIMAVFSICQLLYPYSRFVYESIIEYIFGENVFFVNAIFMLIVKLFTMLMCWIWAPFIAPIGMLYLYFYHTKQEKIARQQAE